jgi:hypothetical protein
VERFYLLLPANGHSRAFVLDEAVSLDAAAGFHPGAVVMRADAARADPRWKDAVEEWERDHREPEYRPAGEMLPG